MTDIRHGSFQSLVADPKTHAVVDLSGEARSLLIVFGGIAGGISMPVFEFFRLAADVPGKKVFLRDPRRGWYQLGIPGIGDSAASVQAFLQETIVRANVERVVMVGASAGGFAALLFGSLCQVDEILAFSPQTFIDRETRRRAGDERWADQIEALHAAAPRDGQTLDLLHAIPAANAKPRMQIHVSSDDPLDMLHAHRLQEYANVEIFEHERGGHRLVKTLRDRGQLKPMLLAALAGAGAAPR